MFDDLAQDQRRLNVGCGFDKRPGYINVDLQSFHKPDVIGNALDLHMFASNWAEELLAYDVIEHFGRLKTAPALLEWNRVLKSGGRLRLTTTYLPGLLRRMSYDWFGSLETHKGLILNLFSTQAYEGDYHLTAFTEKLMRYHLWSCGFEIETIRIKDNWIFDIVAIKVVDYSYTELVDADISESHFVTELYRQVLGREPEPAGLEGKLASLRDGLSTRRTTASGVLHSQEREDRMMAQAPEFNLEFDPA